LDILDYDNNFVGRMFTVFH